MSSNENESGEPASKNQRVDVNGNRAAGVSRDYDVSFLRAALAADSSLYRSTSQSFQGGGPEVPAQFAPEVRKPRWDDNADAMEVDEDEDSLVGMTFQTDEEVGVLYFSTFFAFILYFLSHQISILYLCRFFGVPSVIFIQY